MDPDNASMRLDALRSEIALKYGVSGSLERQLRKIGRTLPRYERRQAAALVLAEQALGHPELQEQIEPATFDRAETALWMHLEGVDARDRRKGVMLDITTTVLVNVLVGVVLMVVLWSLIVSA